MLRIANVFVLVFFVFLCILLRYIDYHRVGDQEAMSLITAEGLPRGCQGAVEGLPKGHLGSTEAPPLQCIYLYVYIQFGLFDC